MPSDSKKPAVPASPCPPNEPNSFWAPCPTKNAPTTTRSTKSAMSTCDLPQGLLRLHRQIPGPHRAHTRRPVPAGWFSLGRRGGEQLGRDAIGRVVRAAEQPAREL